MRIRNETNRSYTWKTSKFMVFVSVYSGFGGQELETGLKNQENHQQNMKHHQNHCKTKKNTKKNTIFKPSLKIEFWWFFLVFTAALVVKSSKPV